MEKYNNPFKKWLDEYNQDKEELRLAIEKLNELETQIEGLRSFIDTKTKTSLIGYSDEYYVLCNNDWNGTFHAEPVDFDSGILNVHELPVVLQSRDQALAYGEAFGVLVQLRYQQGTIQPFNSEDTDGKKFNWVISPKINNDNKVIGVSVNYLTRAETAGACISPVFKTREYAEDAIKFIGVENLIHMFRTFHHMS